MGLSLYSASFTVGENVVNIGNACVDRGKQFILSFAIRHYKFVSRSCTFISLKPIQMANNDLFPLISPQYFDFFKNVFYNGKSLEKNNFVMLLYEMGSMDVKWIIFVSTFIYWL